MSIGREDYQDRKEARVERYEERVARAQAESAAASQAAHDILKYIPPGQPILVGHHSERGHRRALEKSDNNMRKSIEAGEKAAYYAGRAASAASNTAISSDDPDALEKLEAKLAKLQADQEWDKGLNAHYRKHGTVKGYEGISDEGAAKIDAQLAEQDASPYSSGRHLPIPSWQLSNRNAEINRLKKRIVSLQCVDQMVHCFWYINRQAKEFMEKEIKDADPNPASGMYGGDAPDDLVYQWAVDYFDGDDIPEDKKGEEKFVPRPYIGKPGTTKAKTKTGGKPKAAKPEPAQEGQISFLGEAG